MQELKTRGIDHYDTANYLGVLIDDDLSMKSEI